MVNRALLALVGVVLLAGCVGFAPGGGNPTGATEVTSATATATSATPSTQAETTVDAPPPTDCGNVWVAFYAVGTDVQDRLWDSDQLSIGYTVPGGESVFFVAYEDGGYRNGSLLGAEHVKVDTGYPITADGAPVELDRSLSGEHTVRVVAHADSDGDGEFDRTTDRACLSDGQMVTTGPRTFDFSEFGDETAEETTGETPDG